MFDLKKLVSSLVNRNGPQSSIAQSATTLVNELPEAEYAGALVEIVKSIAKINAETDISLKERLKTLLYIDERTHVIHEHLCDDFLAGKAGVKSFLPSILAYLQELSKAYSICLKLYQGNPQAVLAADIRLATARALNHQMRLTLWNALSYLNSDGMLWQQGYRFYLSAEEQGCDRLPLKLYESDREETTCEHILLRGAMLQLAQTDNLRPAEIVAVERLLYSLAGCTRFEKQPNLVDEPVFLLNLETPAAPQPMRRGTLGRGVRYWSGQPLANRLADIMLDLDKGLPSILTQTRLRFSENEWVQLCSKLATRWSRDGGLSLRKSERSLQMKSVAVDVGFERIAFLAKVQNAYPSGEDSSEEWRLQDVSQTGMGLNYFGRHLDKLVLGRLLMMREEDGNPRLGVIRRISRENSGNARVGVELFGHSPIGVSLTDPALPDMDPQNGLYITQPNSADGKRWFLLPKGLAEPHRELVLTVQGQSYRIRLKEPLQPFGDSSHSDFDTLARL
ncbi:PilZ domain-containing protein [Crenobacter cavernae]|uniref:PilZ domain-containing protein n=1 Tax=Crenobacter cavernae TaxID=2290923 RepID=A0ABY0F9H9_9NEIS|nr:PilZ domain-containing protein [Crenobacter cavernae]RXZ42130.1 PilZ domain-containing protein [Crenobacter cavernae]